MRLLFASLLCMASIVAVQAQPAIISVAPSSAMQGQTLNVLVEGMNTHFQQGLTQVDFGAGVNVQVVNVSSPNRLSALVQVEAAAADGFRQLAITTGEEQVVMESALEIFAAGGGIRAVLTIVPKDVLYLSDFDGNNLQSMPLLFNISVFNGTTQEKLRVRLEVSHDEYGRLLTAGKDLGTVSPNQVVMLNNRDLEDYSTSGASKTLLDEANKTGLLPPGIYTYKIIVLNANGEVVAEDEGNSVISNLLTGLELIGPGTAMNETPEVIYTGFPLFQWFSNSNEFKFQIFEVRPGQSSPDDIADNIPVYEQSGIFNTFFQYPNSAEILKEGQTYAWRVTATFLDSRGTQTRTSELYWFSYEASTEQHLQVERLEVEPANQKMMIGQAQQFTAMGFDKDGNEVPVQVNWQVIPSDGGTIDANGLFKAGTQPKPVAILANYKGLSEHTSVILQWNPDWMEDNMMKNFIREVFGL